MLLTNYIVLNKPISSPGSLVSSFEPRMDGFLRLLQKIHNLSTILASAAATSDIQFWINMFKCLCIKYIAAQNCFGTAYITGSHIW
jgi:hypothetical protein